MGHLYVPTAGSVDAAATNGGFGLVVHAFPGHGHVVPPVIVLAAVADWEGPVGVWGLGLVGCAGEAPGSEGWGLGTIRPGAGL